MANPLICIFNPITGFIDQTASVSIGPGVAGAPVVLNVSGLVDPSLLGTALTAVAGEAISGGRLVSLYSVGSALKVQNAYAGSGGTAPSGATYPVPAVGFVTSGIIGGNSGIVQFTGLFTYVDPNSEFLASDVGAEVYLSATSPLSANAGGITKTRPSGVGQLQQTVGTVVNFTSPNLVTVRFVDVPNPPLLNFSNISTGTNTSATMTVGTGGTLTFSGTGIVNANQLTGDPVSTTGRTTGQALVWNGTTWVPQSGVATAFSQITSGTNTTATMTVGSGAALTFGGTGTLNANQIYGVTISSTPPTTGQALVATSATTAAWSTEAVTFNNIGSGTNTTATMTVGSGASLVVSGTGVVEATELATTGSPVVVSSSAPPSIGQSLVATSATTATWQTVTAGSVAFSGITTGTNTTATMTVGSGASIVTTGTGVVEATELATTGSAVIINTTAPAGAGQALVTTSTTNATWQTVVQAPASPSTSVQYNNAGVFGGSANFEWNNGSNILTVVGTTVTSGFATSIVTKVSAYTATATDHTINCNGTFTLTLPTAGIQIGQEYYIKNIGTGTITVSSSVNIDFATSTSLTTPGQSIIVQWDGTQWWIY